MIIKKTKFDGLLEIKFDIYSDKRGNFIKIFNKGNSKLFTNVCYESYINTSKKGVVRGLHGQLGRYSQDKLIYCIKGKLIDPSKKYYISTNDYLLDGGDNMFFLEKNSRVYRLGYSLRDAFINFTKSNLKLSSNIDNRFLKNE